MKKIPAYWMLKLSKYPVKKKKVEEIILPKELKAVSKKFGRKYGDELMKSLW